MTFALLAAVSIVLPILSMLIEWIVGVRLSERHHSRHDTYVISTALTGALSLAMLFMGMLGLLLSWLCWIGVFRANMTTMIGFFSSFVVVMFVMWAALRHYRVATYDDYLEVTPFVGPMRTIRYSDIEALCWSRPRMLSSGRDIFVIVNGKIAAVLIGTFDLDQILMRINRNDVLENTP
ncbi:MAG: hypothetical protein IKE22_09045 [Atopobiaceae bacterium]|nr:hypothetical protein [Atopobiaceae bacterium]